MPAYATVADIPDEVDIAIVAVPSDSVTDVVLDCAAKGVHGLVVISAGFAETGEEGRQRQRRLVGPGPQLRAAADRPQLPRHHQHRAPALAQRLAGPVDAAARAGSGSSASPARWAWRSWRRSRRRGLGLSTFVSAGNRADVSGNDLLQYWEEDDRHRGRAALPGVDRQPAQVQPRSPGGCRGASRSSRSSPAAPPRACRWATRSGRMRGAAGRRRRDVPPGRRHPGRQPRRDVRRRPAGRAPAAAVGPPGRRRRQLRRAGPAGRRRRRRGRPGGRASRWRSAPTPTAEDFEEALDAAIDDPDVDAVMAVYIPPLNTTGDEVADVLAAVGEQSDKPLVSTFLGGEGVPELLRVPDVAGRHRRPRLGAVVPGRESAVRALARVVDYAEWRAQARGRRSAAPDEVDLPRARRLVHEVLVEAPDGRDLTIERAARAARRLRHRPVARITVHDRGGGDRGRCGARLGRRAQGRQPSTSGSGPDLAHIWRNIDTEDRDADAWRQHAARSSTLPRHAGFIVQKVGPGRRPGGVRRHGGPALRPGGVFGVSGAPTELLGDRSYRIPPMHRGDAADDGRARSRRRRCCSATGAASRSTSTRSRTCCCGSRQLKNDLPQVRSLDLNRCSSGPPGPPCSTRSAGSSRRRRPVRLVRPPAQQAGRGHAVHTAERRPGASDRVTDCRMTTVPTTSAGHRAVRLLPGRRGRRGVRRRRRRAGGALPGAPRADDRRARRGPSPHDRAGAHPVAG